MNNKTNPKEVKKGCLIIVILIAIIVSILVVTGDNSTNRSLTKQEFRDEKINNLLYGNGRNAVNSKLIDLVKNDLNDPGSMGDIQLSYIDKDSIIIVRQKFTAKNAFGGTVRGDVTVKIDTLGNIIDKVKWID
jgi:hypothetical protein